MRRERTFNMGVITIGKKDFQITETIMNQQDLVFYVENPRVYSVIRENGNDNPSQHDIEMYMRSMEHVKELKVQIEQNGGLLEALLVVQKADEYVVLEGNSRLAAYRILYEGNPSKWGKVRVNLLPDTITEEEIFTLIGSVHLNKKKDWTVFEQAAYVYRQKQLQKCPDSTLAKKVGLSAPTVKKYIDVYQFMVNANDTVQSHWNYYEQYVTSKDIQKYRYTYPEMDDVVVKQIKTGQIKMAKDIRDKLGKIAKASDKGSNRIMRDYINESVDIDKAYTRFEATGKSGNNYGKIKDFRVLMTSDEFLTSLKAESVGNASISFELKKIKKALDKLLKEIEY